MSADRVQSFDARLVSYAMGFAGTSFTSLKSHPLERFRIGQSNDAPQIPKNVDGLGRTVTGHANPPLAKNRSCVSFCVSSSGVVAA
jgi:hypothetical protein